MKVLLAVGVLVFSLLWLAVAVYLSLLLFPELPYLLDAVT